MAKQDMNKDADSYSEIETYATKIWRTIQISRCKIESLLKVLVKIASPRLKIFTQDCQIQICFSSFFFQAQNFSRLVAGHCFTLRENTCSKTLNLSLG
jgi:hypothetical protein